MRKLQVAIPETEWWLAEMSLVKDKESDTATWETEKKENDNFFATKCFPGVCVYVCVAREWEKTLTQGSSKMTLLWRNMLQSILDSTNNYFHIHSIISFDYTSTFLLSVFFTSTPSNIIHGNQYLWLYLLSRTFKSMTNLWVFCLPVTLWHKQDKEWVILQ